MRVRLVIVLCLLAILLGAGCTGSQSLDSKLEPILEPYRFGILDWEFRTFLNSFREPKPSMTENDSGTVLRYFSLAGELRSLKFDMEAGVSRDGVEKGVQELERQRQALEPAVRDIIQRQITGVLAAEGIYNPLDRQLAFKVTFPPVNFRLEEPPALLVVSPRERIETIKTVMLKQDISLQDKVNIEAQVDKLNLSSLVVPLGGVATYPSFVLDNFGLRFAIDTATEEWLHQYLTFKPLGFRYMLHLTGISPNYEIARMSETLASMVSKELGARVYDEFYSNSNKDSRTVSHQIPQPEFDFNWEMRETRRAVDEYLARGEIEKAEQYMESKREFLASKGYYIRKLNQAYFAFYGTYTDSPTSIDPIGTEMRQLRSRVSLRDFMDEVSSMTSRQALEEAVQAR